MQPANPNPPIAPIQNTAINQDEMVIALPNVSKSLPPNTTKAADVLDSMQLEEIDEIADDVMTLTEKKDNDKAWVAFGVLVMIGLSPFLLTGAALGGTIGLGLGFMKNYLMWDYEYDLPLDEKTVDYSIPIPDFVSDFIYDKFGLPIEEINIGKLRSTSSEIAQDAKYGAQIVAYMPLLLGSGIEKLVLKAGFVGSLGINHLSNALRNLRQN